MKTLLRIFYSKFVNKSRIILAIARNIYLIYRLPSIDRDSKVVNDQYNQGAWKLLLAHHYNLSLLPNSLKDFLFKNAILNDRGDFGNKISLVNCGKLVMSTYEEYLKYKSMRLSRSIPIEVDSILEIGCGFGWNLASFRYNGFVGKLYGVDISENGIKLSNLISNKYNLNFETRVMDIKELDPSILSLSSVDLILIYQVLEQLPYDVEEILLKLVNTFPDTRFLIIESAAELFPKNLNLLMTRFYGKKQGYQRSVLKTCNIMSQNNLIKNLSFERYFCSGKFGHESLKIDFRSSPKKSEFLI